MSESAPPPAALLSDVRQCLDAGDSLAICRQLVAIYRRWLATPLPEPQSHDAPWHHLLAHQLTTSALAYCLAAESGLAPEVLAEMRLGALTHHLPREVVSRSEADATRGLLAAAHAAALPGPIDERFLKGVPDTVGVVLGGATRIKRYVFEGSNLTELRGASMLLDHLNRALVPALLGGGNGSEAPPLIEAPECIVYANGGEVLALVPASKAEALCAAIEALYLEHTLVSPAVCAWRSFRLLELRRGPGAAVDLPTDTDLGAAPRAVGTLLRAVYGHGDTEQLQERILRRQGFGKSVGLVAVERTRRREGGRAWATPRFETLPFAAPCRGCGTRMAVIEARAGDERRPLCEPCARKRLVGQRAGRGASDHWWAAEEMAWRVPGDVQSWFDVFVERMNRAQRERAPAAPEAGEAPAARGYPETHPAADLDDLGALYESGGYVGFIYADVNGMGKLLQECSSPDAYRHLSERTEHELKEAVLGTLARLPVGQRRGQRTFPFEIVAIGGDDVCLIVPGQAALDVAVALAEHLERAFPEGQQLDRGSRLQADRGVTRPRSRLSLAVAVAIAPAGTPVHFLEPLVDEQLRLAKRRAAELRSRDSFRYEGSVVDFQVLRRSDAILSGLEAWRKSTLHQDNYHLTYRPYTLPEMIELLATVRALRRHLPRGQLHALCEAVRRGPAVANLHYRYVSRQEAWGGVLRQELEPRWFTADAGILRRRLVDGDLRAVEYETMVPDLLEIYDFVPDRSLARRGR